MDLNRELFRALIFYDFKCGLTQQQCVDRLNLAYANQAPWKATIYNWFGEFHREGQLITAPTPENIEAVRNLILFDQHVTYREIASILGIGMTAVSKNLHEHLGVRKICSRWCKDMLRKFNKGTPNSVYDINCTR